MRASWIVICLLLLPAPGHSEETDQPELLGFVKASAQRQLVLERRFDAQLRADNLRQWMHRLAARPHHVGSAHGKANAEWMAEQFRSWGFEVEIETFHVLFPTPKTRLLEMVAPREFRAGLVEPVVDGDSSAGHHADQLPPYNAYSIDGDVTADLVYVNYGIPEDYEELATLGIDVGGKIVIARYGRSWRGIKPKVAAEHGAIGCILYSDPRDDGFFQGDVYPHGAFKNSDGVQRGSVADMPLYPGDPLTPGVGATRDAVRLEIEESPTLTSIPVLPISHADAAPLLEALGGPVAPEDWRGGLPLTYHVGPGPSRVHLALTFDWKLVEAHDVIARLVGSRWPDEWVLRGNHHDAWVYGADDPVSGMVALLEEARAVGALVADGWRPKRTLIYAAWDAEEPGLLGSTEWVETHAELLSRHAVAYINTDSNGRGFLGAGGSHTLEKFFNQVARAVPDPQKQISVLERARAQRLVLGSPEQHDEARERDDLRLSALGSGSDYTPFLQHLGVAALNVGYGGENRGGEYHSAYDSFDHYVRFGDPGFAYGVTLARTTGRATLRLAEADLLPFDFAGLAETVSGYADDLEELTKTMRTETERENVLIREGHYDAVADPARPYVAPQPRTPVPHLNLAPLHNAVERLVDSARSYSACDPATLLGRPELQQQINQLLLAAERRLTRATGLPGRPWFKHHVYAPGYYTGYGVKTLPAVREAIESRRWSEVDGQVRATASVLGAFSSHVDEIVKLCGKP